MKIALITDTHWGARNDSLTFLDHFHKFYSEIFFPEIEKRGITTIVHLGDIVDRRKYISYQILRRFRQDFVLPILAKNMDFHVLVGNHDVPYKNTNDLNAVRELFAMDGVTDIPNLHLHSEPTEWTFDGLNILMMPWINSGNYAECLDKIRFTRAEIMMAHLEVRGFEMHRGVVSHDGFDPKIFERFDRVFSGHFHKRSSAGNITYLGAPYEMTWSDYDDDRGFHIFDTDTRQLEYIKDPFKMFNKVFYDDTKKKKFEPSDLDFSTLTDTYVKVVINGKQNPYHFDQWMDLLYAASPVNVTIVDDTQSDRVAEDLDVSELEDTPSVLRKYVGAMEQTSVDKDELVGLLISLHSRALQTETV